VWNWYRCYLVWYRREIMSSDSFGVVVVCCVCVVGSGKVVGSVRCCVCIVLVSGGLCC
jgi:hypothetical protein